MRPFCGWLRRSSERPTRGNMTNSAAVKRKIGTESRQVVARKPRPTTRRLRRMRGTSTGRPGAIARALAVVALDLAAQVAEHERARRDDEEAEEAEAVGEAAAEHGAGDEVEQREDDDLLVVRGAAPRGEADDLEDGGELDGDVERGPARERGARPARRRA